VLKYAEGVLFVAENPQSTLYKVGEIYDRIGFAAVGRYSEYETLRVAGIRLADVRGYSYDRRDVTGRALANAYAQTLNSIFTESAEAVRGRDVRRRGRARPRPTTGSTGCCSTARSSTSPSTWCSAGTASRSWRCSRTATGPTCPGRGARAGHPRAGHGRRRQRQARELAPNQLEVAVLDRGRPTRKFRRLQGAALTALLPQAAAVTARAGERERLDRPGRDGRPGGRLAVVR
jgi:proteasome alpha subunit